MTKISHQEALERAYAGRFDRKGEFYEVPTSLFIDHLDVNMAPLPAVSFYKWQNGRPELIRSAEQPYSHLALSVWESILVKEDDLPILRRYAEGMILGATQGTSLTPELRMETLRRSAMLVVEDMFTHPSPENINKGVKVVSSFVYLIMKDPKAYLHLAKLSSHDPYTLQHSVGVAVNSIILARKIGLNNERELMEVGLGGLLHDIGKTKVRIEIINKPGPLNEEEWKEMRKHSEEGFLLVQGNSQIGDHAKRAVLEHHEDKIGTGYPKGLKSNDLDIYSKIVGIADVFNALTTNRSYSKARTPFDAFQLMRDKMTHKLDEELFRNLVLIYGGKLD